MCAQQTAWWPCEGPPAPRGHPAPCRAAAAGRPPLAQWFLSAAADRLGHRVWPSVSTNGHTPKTPKQPVLFQSQRHLNELVCPSRRPCAVGRQEENVKWVSLDAARAFWLGEQKSVLLTGKVTWERVTSVSCKQGSAEAECHMLARHRGPAERGDSSLGVNLERRCKGNRVTGCWGRRVCLEPTVGFCYFFPHWTQSPLSPKSSRNKSQEATSSRRALEANRAAVRPWSGMPSFPRRQDAPSRPFPTVTEGTRRWHSVPLRVLQPPRAPSCGTRHLRGRRPVSASRHCRARPGGPPVFPKWPVLDVFRTWTRTPCGLCRLALSRFFAVCVSGHRLLTQCSVVRRL